MQYPLFRTTMVYTQATLTRSECWSYSLTASTAISEKKSLSCVRILLLRVVFAILRRSRRNFSGSAWLFIEQSSNTFLAHAEASLNPAIIVMGWSFCWTSFSASRSNSPARTTTDVVPSPTSSSWTFDISISTFAAGLSTYMLFRIVAPSFVTVTLCPRPTLWSILSIPFGPNVVLTRSAIAIAPMNEDCVSNMT